MGFTLEAGIPAITVFLQGIISFFSPCVLPLVPLYIGYLAGGTKQVDENGVVTYKRSKVLVNTIFFVIGVSFAFFLLGFGFTAAGRFFGGNRVLFARIGGIIVILFGLYQLGVFGKGAMGREHRFSLKLNQMAMNPILALVLGFTFSFAWTPCVGPALASVLLMASSANSSAAGFMLIGVYTIGFVLPFLAVGIFTGSLLDLFKKHRNVVNYTMKIGGALMVLMGVMMWNGWMNGITGYLSGVGATPPSSKEQVVATTEADGTTEADQETTEESKEESESGKPSDENAGIANESEAAGNEESETSETTEAQALPAPDFTLIDQYGNEHTLSDYKGKVVFLNFWATWCGPCKMEMPDIQELYEEYGENQNDVVFLGVANPKTDERPNNSDIPVDEIKTFLTDNGYTYPTAMDLTGDIFMNYYVSAFPTTYMIDKEGNVYGYVTGTLTKDIMENIIKQTLDSSN